MGDDLKKFLVGVTNDCAIACATVGGVALPKRDKFGVGTMALLTDAEASTLIERIKGQGFYHGDGGRPVDCKISVDGCEKLADYAFVIPWDDNRDPEAEPVTISEAASKDPAKEPAKKKSK